MLGAQGMGWAQSVLGTSASTLTLKSMPTVEMKVPARKAPSLKRTSKQVFPTPESPTSMTWGTKKAEGTWVLAHPEECLVFSELAWSDGLWMRVRSGGRYPKSAGSAGPGGDTEPGLPSSTSRRFCALS